MLVLAALHYRRQLGSRYVQEDWFHHKYALTFNFHSSLTQGQAPEQT